MCVLLIAERWKNNLPSSMLVHILREARQPGGIGRLYMLHLAATAACAVGKPVAPATSGGNPQDGASFTAKPGVCRLRASYTW